MQEMQVWALDWEDPLKKEMATHSSILAWEIPGTEELGGLQSIGSKKVEQLGDWTTTRRSKSLAGGVELLLLAEINHLWLNDYQEIKL